MPGRLFIECDTNALLDWSGTIARESEQSEAPDLPDSDIAPGQLMWVMTASGEAIPMRWGMIMAGQSKGRRRPLMETIVNARSETVFEKQTFAEVRRALVPAHGWYEWTGEKGRKTRWRLRASDEGLLMFAAVYSVWNGPGGVRLHQFATLTCEPNDTVRPIHHRMGVIVPRENWEGWLKGESVSLAPAPDAAITVSEVAGMGR